MTDIVIGGIEGGATHSTLVLLNQNGKELSRVNGPHTNHWSIGMQECQKRIAQMVADAKDKANIPQEQKLQALGLCLSGCEQDGTNTDLWQGLRAQYPNISENYVVSSDTDGSICTVAEKGGMVLISGTGSNCLLINPDGSRWSCGGWGHMIGDEGSAFWISFRAVKIIFDHEDNLVPSTFDITGTWEAIRSHFSVENRADILEHCYRNFEKDKFAGLCEKLAQRAEEGDPLCQNIFQEAGDVLAAYILAQIPRIAQELKTKSGGIHVLCVGSVWKSWELLKTGFIPRLKSGNVEELSLTKLTITSALGAAYLAADTYKIKIPKTYEKNHQVFYHYKR